MHLVGKNCTGPRLSSVTEIIHYCVCLSVGRSLPLLISIAASLLYFIGTVGNKNDCPDKKVVQTEDAQKFADQIGIQLYETSAKENINVEEVCMYVYTCWWALQGGEGIGRLF